MARACCTASAHSRQQPGPLLAHRAPGGDCSADNPLRALLRFSTAAREFCPSYLRDNGPLPTYITQYNSAEVSSACACFELSIGCCTTSTGTPDPTADILATTTARTQAKPASRSALDKSPSQTTPSAQLSPDLGSEDPTSARPTEYSYTPDPSTATITASMRGPSTVPDPKTIEAEMSRTLTSKQGGDYQSAIKCKYSVTQDSVLDKFGQGQFTG
ncbi:MAG: hypothetical protein LQ344_001189 [Seirophora lacunosa]|nr:MAG: hypothetical protein LQ344_001189 [Seirophora lacunosa]